MRCTKQEKPDASGCETGRCLCMESDTDGRLASRPKPYPENDHHLSHDEETGLYRYVGTLSPDQVKVANRPVASGWCERRTVSLLLTAVYSIMHVFRIKLDVHVNINQYHTSFFLKTQRYRLQYYIKLH